MVTAFNRIQGMGIPVRDTHSLQSCVHCFIFNLIPIRIRCHTAALSSSGAVSGLVPRPCGSVPLPPLDNPNYLLCQMLGHFIMRLGDSGERRTEYLRQLNIVKSHDFYLFRDLFPRVEKP